MYDYKLEFTFENAWTNWIGIDGIYKSWQAALDKRSMLIIDHQSQKTNNVMRVRVHVLRKYTSITMMILDTEEMLKDHSAFLKFMEEDETNYNRIQRRMLRDEYEGKFDANGFYRWHVDTNAAEKTMSESIAKAEEYENHVSIIMDDEPLEPEASLNAPMEQERYARSIYRMNKEANKEVDFHGNFAELTEEQQDAIINPSHYKMVPGSAYEKYPNGLEYIDLMEYMLGHHKGVEAHLIGQIFKYTMRLGKKDADLQDAKKIEWYANRLVSVIAERS